MQYKNPIAAQQHAFDKAKAKWGKMAFVQSFPTGEVFQVGVQIQLGGECTVLGEGKSWREAFLAAQRWVQ